MALRCARGERGVAEIRGGRRHVQLSEIGGRILWFEPAAALASTSRLAQAVRDAPDLEAAELILQRLGIRSELAFERDVAAAGCVGESLDAVADLGQRDRAEEQKVGRLRGDEFAHL